VINATRERALHHRASKDRIVERCAERHTKRYAGLIAKDDLASIGNIALVRAVQEYRDELGGFEDFCRRRIDFAMLDGIRIEATQRRIERAAERAAADLLALYRGNQELVPHERLQSLADAVATATFIAMAEEAQRGATEDELVASGDYVFAVATMQAVLSALPKPQQKLFSLIYRENKSLIEAQKVLGVHYNTVRRWHQGVLDETRKQLAQRGITQLPNAPRSFLHVSASAWRDEDETQR